MGFTLNSTSANNRLTTGTALASASITPVANDFMMAVAYCHTSGGTDFTDTATCSGNGLTWTKRGASLSADNKQYLAMFTAQEASPSAGAVTITVNTSVTEAYVNVAKVTYLTSTISTSAYVTSGAGVTASGTSWSAATGTPTDPLNLRFVYFGKRVAATTSPAAGWLELQDYVSGGTSISLGGQYNSTGNETMGASWSGAAVGIYAYVEIATNKALVPGWINSYDDSSDLTPQAGVSTTGWDWADIYTYRQSPLTSQGSWS